MKKFLFAIIATLAGVVLPVRAEMTLDWRMHLPFDSWGTKVIETPNRIYFLGRTFEYNLNVSGRDFNSFSLHYYDKKGDEVLTMSTDNQLSDNIISCIAYNPQREYLLVAYSNCNIDFIYDDGRVENVSALKMLTIPGKKEINSISFDNANRRVYLATSFGYVALNDLKYEVAESRTYNESVKSVARVGDNLIMTIGDSIYTARVSSPRFNLSEYQISDEGTPAVDNIYPLNGNLFLAVKLGGNGIVYAGEFNDDGTLKPWGAPLVEESNIIDIFPRKEGGYQMTGNVNVYQFSLTGSHTAFSRPNDAWRNPASSLNGNQLWSLVSEKGLRLYEKSGGSWTVTKDYMRPNSPATYICTSLAYHPEFGMLAGSNGVDIALNIDRQNTRCQVSGIKGRFWKEYSPIYTNASGLISNTNYTGVTIDPQNPQYVYRGSYFNGLLRLNLKDPQDIMVFAHPSSANSGLNGFVKIVPDLGWAALCRFTPPEFDSEGTMWSMRNNSDAHIAEVYYWTAANRTATTNAQTYRPMGKIDMPEAFYSSNYDAMIALTHANNKNIIAIGGYNNNGVVLLYDTNGTLNTTADDKYVIINNPYDQDGGLATFLVVNNLYEDPSTGMLWIMTQRGLFTVNPRSAFENPTLVNRIKVSRNDGTQLADYLLNEVNVNHISTDGDNRKWFSTSNGLVCTSADGRTVYGEFTSSNSPLPDNNVYVTKYNPETGSILAGTGQGIVEIFPSGSGQGSVAGNSGPRIYPNPVEPDYYGWVHIDNIAEGSIVKITDSQGGIVKELGPAHGGSVEWDVTNMNHSRVSSGVYYVMVSPGNGMTGETTISKILVLN